MIVGRDLRHAEQRLAVGGLATFLQRALMRKEGLRLHEKPAILNGPADLDFLLVRESDF
jgi:hypothetical protein